MMADKQTLDAYATRVEEYVSIPVTDAQADALNRFMARLPKGCHVLDLGCGPGHAAAEMAKAGFGVTAIDASPEFVEAARALGVDARVATFDDLAEVDTYDGVWASFSLLHAPRVELPKHLAAIKQALKPEGHLFLGMKLGDGEERDDLGRFYSYFSREELEHHLVHAGFSIDGVVVGEGKGLAGRVDPYALILAHA